MRCLNAVPAITLVFGVSIGSLLIPALAQASPAPDPSCVPNPTNEADGITLVDSGTNDPFLGVKQVVCRYGKANGNPIPVREYGFRVMCPSGYRLAQPGFSFPNAVSGQKLMAIVPLTTSSDEDVVDVSVAVDSASVNFALMTYALCRKIGP